MQREAAARLEGFRSAPKSDKKTGMVAPFKPKAANVTKLRRPAAGVASVKDRGRLTSELRSGRIVLVDLEKALPADRPPAFAHLRDSFALFRELGAQAVLLQHNVHYNVPGWVDTGNARGTILPIPAEDIGWEDHLLVRRHLARAGRD